MFALSAGYVFPHQNGITLLYGICLKKKSRANKVLGLLSWEKPFNTEDQEFQIN